MHFDALCLACITHELTATLLPGRVQNVLAPAAQSIAFEVYANHARHWLLIHADPVQARVQIESGKVRRGVQTETPLLLLLRKYARNAMLNAITQPDPSERLLQVEFSHRAHGATLLNVELIGRTTNIILCKPDGRILDLQRRAPSADAWGRVLMPGRTWSPPPVNTRLAPYDDGDGAYYDKLAQITHAPGALWKALTTTLRGVGNSQAHEIAWRATGNANAPAAGTHVLALAQALQELWSPVRTGTWQPGVWLVDGRVAGFSPWRWHGDGEFEARATLSEALTAFHQARAEPAAARVAAPATTTADAYAVARAQVAALIERARKRVIHARGALAGDAPAPGEVDALRQHAEWLLALQHTINEGQTTLEVDTGAETLAVPLDPHKTPIEQAQALFKRAGKLARAEVIIPQRRAQLDNDLAFLAQAESDLANASNQPEIETVRAMLQESGLLGPQARKAKPVRPSPSQPRRFRAADGTRILVGRNARQNDALTFTTARPDDIWMHARGAPGSHVVVQVDGRAPAEATLLSAAQLAAWYSDLRSENAVDVVVALRKRLARPPGGRPGQVLVREESVLRVPVRLPEDVVEE